MHDYQENTNLFGNVQNVLFLLRRTDELFLLWHWLFWVQSNFQVTKNQQKQRKQKKKPLQGANVRTSWISFSPSQNSHETNKRRRYSPWARKWNPPPTPSGIFVDMYHFKASPKGIEKCMFALDCLVGVAVQQHSFPQQRVTGYPHQEVSQPLLKHHYRQK